MRRARRAPDRDSRRLRWSGPGAAALPRPARRRRSASRSPAARKPGTPRIASTSAGSCRTPASACRHRHRLPGPRPLRRGRSAERQFDGPVVRDRPPGPGPPGDYTAEVWLEDALGGRAHTRPSRFASTTPARPSAAARQPGWLGRADFPYPIRIEHPQAPLPRLGDPRLRDLGRRIARRPALRRPEPVHGDRDRPAGRDRRRLDARSPNFPRETSHVHVVAVSGSGMQLDRDRRHGASRRQDRSGDAAERRPGCWTNHAFTVTASAADADSGMAGGGRVHRDQGRRRPAHRGRRRLGERDRDRRRRPSHRPLRPGCGRQRQRWRDAQRSSQPRARRRDRRDRPGAAQVAFLAAQRPRRPGADPRPGDRPAGRPERRRGSIGVRAAGSGDRFQPLPTQVLADGLRARWDSEAYPPGRYEFRATGYDAAGNAEHRRPDGPRQPAEDADDPQHRLRWRDARLAELHPQGRAADTADAKPCLSSAPAAEPRRSLRPRDAGQRPAENASGRRSRARRSGSSRPSVTVPGQGEDRDGRHRRRRRLSIRLPAGPESGDLRQLRGHPDADPRGDARAAARRPQQGQASRLSPRRPGSAAGRSSSAAGSSPAPARCPPPVRRCQLQFRLPGMPLDGVPDPAGPIATGRFRYAYRFSDDDSRGAGSSSAPTCPRTERLALRAGRARASRGAGCCRESSSGARDLVAELRRPGPGRGELLADACGRAARRRCGSASASSRPCGWRLRASRSTRLRVLRASVVALRRAVCAAALAALHRAAELGAVGLAAASRRSRGR